MSVYPVILCGGSGTRLWPSSRPDRPKQFLPLLPGGRSTFEETLLRVRDLDGAREAVVVTGAAHVELVRAQAAGVGMDVTVLVEPEARDSAPAIAAAAAHVRALEPAGVLLMLAADHHVRNVEGFHRAVAAAARAAADGGIATFGVTPGHPATGYGYIRPGEPLEGDTRRVGAFVEKPDLARAREYLAAGYYWNSGNFAFRADVLLGELDRFQPQMGPAVEAAVARARRDADGVVWLDREAFAGAPRISIDFAVMEDTDRAVVVPATFDWSDLGAWDAIHEVSTRDEDGNSASGEAILAGCRASLVHANGPMVAAVGVDNLLIVAEPDAVLVCGMDRAQEVKGVADALKRQGRPVALRHLRRREGEAEVELAWEGAGATTEIWRLPAGAAAALPAAAVQVLEGTARLGDREMTAGDQAELPAGEAASPAGAVLLVTRWR